MQRFPLPSARGWTRLAAGAVASALVLGAAAPGFAQGNPPPPAAGQPPAPPPGADRPPEDRPPPPLSPTDRKAFLDARVAAVKAGLQLTPDQEKLWPQTEKAVRAFADAMRARHEARRAEFDKLREARRNAKPGERPEAPDLLQRLRQGAEGSLERGQALKALAEGVAPLYEALTPEQKNRLRMLVGKRAWGAFEHGGMGGDGPGWGGPGRHHGPRHRD